ncbi:MAG: hypothetical protein R6W78_16865, partial [Bacteroidales bacterium]
MKNLINICLLLIILIISSFLYQAFAFSRLKNKTVKSLHIVYDENILRIPGNRLPFGIIARLSNGELHATRGYLKGRLNWNNFIVRVQGGKLVNNKLFIAEQESLKENQMIITVESVYSPEIVAYEVINLNYEKSLQIVPSDTFVKAPGYPVPLDFEVVFDNGSLLKVNSKTTGAYTLKNLDIHTVGGDYQKNALRLSPYPEDFTRHEGGIMVRSKMDTTISD